MDFKKYIQGTIEQIQADSEKELVIIKQRAAVEKIAPEFAKIEQKKKESLIALDDWLSQQKTNARVEYDEKIARLDAKYIEDKNSIDEAVLTEKNKIEEAIITVETSQITEQRNFAVAKLSALLEE